MEKLTNIIFKDFGTFINTNRGEQYEINKVIIFKDNQIKVIANYFLDNFKDYRFEFLGDTQRKIKADLSSNNNFVIKSEKQESWNNKTQYILYINGNINKYIFDKLELNGEQLNLIYNINDLKCSQCIGWIHKESNKIKYNEELTKMFDYIKYFDAADSYKSKLDYINKQYKKYIKAKEKEKNYTTQDYKKMSLESGTTKEENITMLKNNNFDVRGL